MLQKRYSPSASNIENFINGGSTLCLQNRSPSRGSGVAPRSNPDQSLLLVSTSISWVPLLFFLVYCDRTVVIIVIPSFFSECTNLPFELCHQTVKAFYFVCLVSTRLEAHRQGIGRFLSSNVHLLWFGYLGKKHQNQ